MRINAALLAVAAGVGLAAGALQTVLDLGEQGRLRSGAVPANFCGPLASESGYFDINATTNKHYFYWSFPSQSNKTTDPVFIWLTGGPGCSSSVALLTENGPCFLHKEGNGTIPNPNSWNKNAHAIWIDQPAGVGYSYANVVTGGDYTEAEVAYDLYRFIQAYMQAHPDLQANDFFIVGESYAGHYVPSIAKYVFDANINPPPGDVRINLKGVAIGNGLVDSKLQYPAYPTLAYNYSIQRQGKPVISLDEYTKEEAALPGCLTSIDACQNNTGDCLGAYLDCNLALISPYQATGMNPYNILQECTQPPLCMNTAPLERFMNSPTTQATLGVEFMLWIVCDPIVEEGFLSDWQKEYHLDLVPLLEAGIPVLVYNGDLDFVCNWLGGQAWTAALPWSGQAGFDAAPMAPWTVDGVAAGQLRNYSTLNFLRFYNASHMVPATQPARSLAMINTFMATGGL